MKSICAKNLIRSALVLYLGLALGHTRPLGAQVPWPVASQFSAGAQNTAQNGVRSQAGTLQNTLRSAPTYLTGAYELVWQQFQMFCDSYNGLRSTLSPQQLQAGANDLAELDAGLGILQESFANYQQDIAAGQSANRALLNMCQVLGRATTIWLQQFNKVCIRLRVGWV